MIEFIWMQFFAFNCIQLNWFPFWFICCVAGSWARWQNCICNGKHLEKINAIFTLITIFMPVDHQNNLEKHLADNDNNKAFQLATCIWLMAIANEKTCIDDDHDNDKQCLYLNIINTFWFAPNNTQSSLFYAKSNANFCFSFENDLQLRTFRTF